MSTVMLIVSSGGPATRSTSSFAAPVVPWFGAGAERCASVRFIDSGLNWKMMSVVGCDPGVCVGYTASAPFWRLGRRVDCEGMESQPQYLGATRSPPDLEGRRTSYLSSF